MADLRFCDHAALNRPPVGQSLKRFQHALGAWMTVNRPSASMSDLAYSFSRLSNPFSNVG
jgi:hypothetical protein